MGKEKSVKNLIKIFEDVEKSSEISIEQQKNGMWALVIEQRAPHIDSSIQHTNSGKSLFFRGHCIDHENEKLVLGSTAFVECCDKDFTSTPLDLEGAFVLAAWDDNRLLIQNDLFNLFSVCWFSTEDMIVASDSLYLLTQLRSSLGLPCILNRDVAATRAWTHGLANAAMTNDTMIKDINFLSPGYTVSVNFRPASLFTRYSVLKEFKVNKQYRPLRKIFESPIENYPKYLLKCIETLYKTLLTLTRVEGLSYSLSLSGGLDSRILLALCLKSPEIMETINFKTNEHSSRAADYNIVKKLMKKYNLSLKEKSTINIKKKKIDNPFGLWILSNLGLFDMVYLRKTYFPSPYVLDIGGHGAEAVKGTFVRPLSSLIDWAPKNTYETINKTLQRTLIQHGIKPESPDAIQWHHMSFKSGLQNGSFIDCSCFSLRPLLQHQLFSLSRAKCNPNQFPVREKPSLLQDLLIITDPDIAGMPFDKIKKNISRDVIKSRLESLNISFNPEGLEPYLVLGGIADIVNGPAETFLPLVEQYNLRERDPVEAIQEILETHWSKIKGSELEIMYRPAYDLAIERFDVDDPYLPNAGAPVAKIFALSMVDSIKPFQQTKKKEEKIKVKKKKRKHWIIRYLKWRYKIIKQFFRR